MERHKLAEALRDRQRELAIVDEETIAITTDSEMIQSYLTAVQLKMVDLDVVVATVESVENFLDVLASVK